MSNESDDLEILTGTMMILHKHGGLPSRDILSAMDQMADSRRTVKQRDKQVDEMIADGVRIETGPRGRLKVVE